MSNEWISVETRLPEYGEPVLICASGVTQYIVFNRDGCDETPDWFEPYYFESDDELKIWWNKVTHWQYLPSPPDTGEK